MSSHDEATTFKVNVRLVLVRAVVRDGQGHAVGNLRKEDFQLFDNRKPQVITQFSVERPGTQVAREQKTTEIQSEENSSGKTPHVPERFIAFLFDDIHLQAQDLLPARSAADRRLSSLQPSDRAGIFTTSGQGNLDFTDDSKQLRSALLQLQPRPVVGNVSDCPHMSYYMADQIINKNDPQALSVATRDALSCAYQNDQKLLSAAQMLAQSTAQQELSLGSSETHVVLASLEDVVRRVSAAPGQRSVVLISPGFITPWLEYEATEIIDRALRASVVVSAVDARGLYVPKMVRDIGGSQPSMAVAGQVDMYETAEDFANSDVLSALADSTGGVFVHNTNDLEGGLRRAAETPEYYYVLGFSPQNLKYDGRFHNLSVTLNTPQKLAIQARKGYYAPKQPPNAEEEAKQEIQEAVFSQEEIHDLPVELHTQFFKPSEVDAKLAVLVHVDVKRLHFRKADGRNNDDLTIVAALFDRNGSYVTGNAKILQMHWKDETLEHKLDRGLTLKSSFDVKPGSYLVRMVVRDTEGLLSAENGAIEIP